jgi:carbonic anhydrase/acetyltransferase-like protein (isoleucine patch superfamily)
MSSTIQRGAVVESDCLVAANSLVTEDQTIPSGHLAYGAPAETRPLEPAHRETIGHIHERYVEHAETYRRAGLE